MKFARFITIKLLLVFAGIASFSAAHAQGLQFTPGSVNFNNTTLGSVSAEQAVSVEFIQSPPFAMTMNVTSMVLPANPAFVVTSNTCTTGSYTPYVPCEIKFTFTTPAASGVVTDRFRFVTSELGNQDIALKGSSDGAPPPSPQTITFTSTVPTGAIVGGTYEVAATGGGSGLPVTFSVDSTSNAVCSMIGDSVSFLSPGPCLIHADQAGNSAYEAAPRQTQTILVAPAPLAPQAITFNSTPPNPAIVGESYDVSAIGGGSGNPVVLSIEPNSTSICSISDNMVSFTAEGSCVVLANQAGNTAFTPASQVAQTFTISAKPDVPPAATPTPVPTLSQWSLMLLASMLGGLTFWRQRRKS